MTDDSVCRAACARSVEPALPAVLLLSEAARVLGVPPESLISMVGAALVPCATFAGDLRFSRDRLLELRSSGLVHGDTVDPGRHDLPGAHREPRAPTEHRYAG